MKSLKFYLVSLLFVSGLVFIPYSSKAQDVKLNRQEKKDLEQTKLKANFQAIDTLLERKTFVLEADFLRNRYGLPVPVTSVLNFILVDSSHVVLQTGSNYHRGFNGVGGVTAEGNIQNYKVVKDSRNLSFTVSFSVMTNVGIFDIFMTISADTSASATITGLSSGRLTWDGYFKNLYNTFVYKGRETY